MQKALTDVAIYTAIGGVLLWAGAPAWALAIPGAAIASVLIRHARRQA